MRNTILYTILLIVFVMIAYALFRYFPHMAALLPSGRNIQTITRDAGASWKVEIHLTEKHRALALIVPDRRMDRRWNTNNLETQVGLRLERVLNERGVDTAVFDRADAGQPPERFEDPTTIQAQIAAEYTALESYRDSQESLQKTPLVILAHGDGCLATLSAVEAHHLNPERILLFGCAYQGTLLQTYGDVILNTMRLDGVPAAQREQAAKEWDQWIQQKEFEEITPEQWRDRQKKMLKDGENHDIVAFRKTLAVFQRPENRAWLLAAKKLSYKQAVEATLKRTRATIEAYPAEFDEEVPAATIEANRQTAAGFGPRFIFRTLSQTDHFLFERGSPPASPVENMMSRSNPFKDFSPAFLRVLEEQWP